MGHCKFVDIDGTHIRVQFGDRADLHPETRRHLLELVRCVMRVAGARVPRKLRAVPAPPASEGGQK